MVVGMLRNGPRCGPPSAALSRPWLAAVRVIPPASGAFPRARAHVRAYPEGNAACGFPPAGPFHQGSCPARPGGTGGDPWERGAPGPATMISLTPRSPGCHWGTAGPFASDRRAFPGVLCGVGERPGGLALPRTFHVERFLSLGGDGYSTWTPARPAREEDSGLSAEGSEPPDPRGGRSAMRSAAGKATSLRIRWGPWGCPPELPGDLPPLRERGTRRRRRAAAGQASPFRGARVRRRPTGRSTGPRPIPGWPSWVPPKVSPKIVPFGRWNDLPSTEPRPPRAPARPMPPGGNPPPPGRGDVVRRRARGARSPVDRPWTSKDWLDKRPGKGVRIVL